MISNSHLPVNSRQKSADSMDMLVCRKFFCLFDVCQEQQNWKEVSNEGTFAHSEFRVWRYGSWKLVLYKHGINQGIELFFSIKKCPGGSTEIQAKLEGGKKNT